MEQEDALWPWLTDDSMADTDFEEQDLLYHPGEE